MASRIRMERCAAYRPLEKRAKCSGAHLSGAPPPRLTPISTSRAATEPLRLRRDGHLHLRHHLRVEPHFHLVRSDLLQRLTQVHVLPLDRVSRRDERLVHVLGGDRAEEPVLLAYLASEPHLDGRELLGHRAHVLLLLRRARQDARLLVLELADVLRRREHRQVARQQVVAAVAGLHLDQRPRAPQVLQVLRQDDLHVRASYWCCMTVKGKSATCRPRLIAVATWRWCRAQFPEIRRGTILPRSVMKYFRSAAFL